MSEDEPESQRGQSATTSSSIDVFISYASQDAAVDEFKQVSYEPVRIVGLSKAYFDMDRRLESDRALAELTAKYGPSDPYLVAFVHTYRQERDAAFDWLAKALNQRDSGVWGILADPLMAKNLASDPRYHAILRHLNLPE